MTRIIGRWLLLALCLIPITLQAALPANMARIHYNRSQGDYEGWGLHIWGSDLDFVQEVSWKKPLKPSGQDSFGIYFDIPIKPGANEAGFILHQGNFKNVAKDMAWGLSSQGREIWQLEGDPTIYTSRPKIDNGQPEPPVPVKPVPLARVPEVAPRAPSSEGATLALLDKLRREMETRLLLETQNQTRLQAELLSEQQGRQVAEQLLKQREQALVQSQIEASSAATLLNEQVKKLSTQLKQARHGNGNTGTDGGPLALLWPLLLALAVLGWLITVVLLRKGNKKRKVYLAEVEAEVATANNRMQKEVEERQSAEQRILQLANYDELTGLPNRAILNQTITQALAKAKRYKKQLAVMFIDLDRFKLINDTMGHGAGDHVLKTVSERFKNCLRDSDTIARLGGDEFVVLVEELADPKYVAGVAQKLVSAAQQPFVIQGQECHVTASIGISTFPGDGKDASNLLKNADIAMYRAKEQGKNNFQYYSEQMNMHSLQRLALESSLRHALERNEFRLHYQPIIDTVSQRIVGVEALVRWQHPDMGMVGPLQFIPIAEETGLIADIGRWVLETACRQGVVWRELGHILNISVNLSPRQLNEPDLITEFQSAFIKTDFPASQLTLEITEGLMLSNPDETVVVLQELKDLGIRIAIDDFGTGYSSLAYLRRFPIDTLKIDRSFLQDIPGDADSAALTAAVIALGHSLHLNVVAEGVETDEQRAFLLDHKCQHLQGYWFCRPKPGEDITALLNKQARSA